jgi:uncharacterized membrane-anchored protein YitT (DUF2179 family)
MEIANLHELFDKEKIMKRVLFIVLGCFLTSIGALMLKHAGVMTGGTAGLSLILSYASGLTFGLVFFLVNIPFYVLSVMFMGWNFTVSTALSVTLLSLMTGIDKWLPPFSIPISVGAVAGGIIIGFGLSMLFIHRTSLGGSNILALILQKKLKWNPGKLNFIFDFVVVVYGFYSIGFLKGILSVLSILITSIIISYFKNRIGASNQSFQTEEVTRGDKKTIAAS